MQQRDYIERLIQQVAAAVARILDYASGERIEATILKTARARVPGNHRMVHFSLEDGRELSASPGHPTVDGRTVGELKTGDRMGGARVVGIASLPYPQPVTYDVLPSGKTGWYWANGILIASTLTAR